LDDSGIAENTLVVFTSDNGGVMDDGYEDVGSFDYHPNAPLAGYKGGLYEGGHRVPFIARWPKVIPAGSKSDHLICCMDMAATFAALLGATIPREQCRDSLNVLPAFVDDNAPHDLRKNLIIHSGGIRGPFAVRIGQWKFLEKGAR